MTNKIITINASERAAQAAQKADEARFALAMAEAELRVWQDIEREAESSGPSRRAIVRPAVESVAPSPQMDSGNHDLSAATRPKRDRRPADRWMTVLGHLGRTPISQDDLATLVAPLGIDRRSLGDQVRRYLGPLGLLDERGGKLELTARARQFLVAYTKESEL